MKYLPLYSKWALEESGNWDELPWGKLPLIISLRSRAQLEKLENYLERREINPHFPYPIYVISQGEDIDSKKINVLSDESEIPRYFNLNPKKLTLLENEIFYRINLLSEKIRNIPLMERWRVLSAHRQQTRELFMASREAQYYEKLLGLLEGEAP